MDLVIETPPAGRSRRGRPRPLAPDSGGTAAGRMDHTLMYTTLALILVGLTSVYTASAAQADLETGKSFSIVLKQIIATGIGLAGLNFLSRFPFTRLKNMVMPLAVVSIGLLLLTQFAGTTANGSERWLALPFGFQFQPSDVAKVAAILLLAQATSQKSLFTTTLVVNLAVVGAMVGLIYQQPNLSVAMILGMLTLSMLFVAGIHLQLLIPSLIGIGYVVVEKIKSTPYQMERITGWLNPWGDPLDTGYNLIQSYYAIAAGGLFGVGLGNSVQKLYYLPFQHTDFIFSVICEEWGYFGALIVVGLFAMLAWRGFRIAWQASNPFGKMLAFGLTMAITLQALINICVTVGLMPVTGVTLPLISYGGTSMVVTLAMIGILLNISRYRSLPRAVIEP